jgi:hypothetical protein
MSGFKIFFKTGVKVCSISSKGVRICLFFSTGAKSVKNSKHWSNEKGPSSTTKIVQRNNSDRSNNAYGYKYFSLLLFYPFVVPADLSQQAKSAAADGLT